MRRLLLSTVGLICCGCAAPTAPSSVQAQLFGAYTFTIHPAAACPFIADDAELWDAPSRAAVTSITDYLTFTQSGETVEFHAKVFYYGIYKRMDISGVVVGDDVTLSVSISENLKFGPNYSARGVLRGRIQDNSVTGMLNGRLLILGTYGYRTYVNCVAPDHPVWIRRRASQP